MAKRPSYEIPRPQPSHEFLRARNVAGCILQEQFKKHGGKLTPSRDYRWIKSDLTWPTFDHLTFAYGNQVFAVLVEVFDDGQSLLSEQECKRCFDAAVKHNLIPCIFPISLEDLNPLSSGWNLLALETNLPLNPVDLATDSAIEMSEWELQNLAIQIVRGSIEERGDVQFVSFSDIVGIDPQLWFEDEQKSKCWVIVRFFKAINGDEIDKFIHVIQTHPQLASFDGYFAAVSAASSAPFLLDRDGKVIPLSRRYDGTAPLYRGDELYIKYDGLKLLHKAQSR